MKLLELYNELKNLTLTEQEYLKDNKIVDDKIINKFIIDKKIMKDKIIKKERNYKIVEDEKNFLKNIIQEIIDLENLNYKLYEKKIFQLRNNFKSVFNEKKLKNTYMTGDFSISRFDKKK